MEIQSSDNDINTASIILAAGRGSRMQGYEGNKTLLPLIAKKSAFEGSRPILLHIIENLPEGPKVVIVNHQKEYLIRSTRSLGLEYCEQPSLNGTGGALLAAQRIIEDLTIENLIITMGDVPFVKNSTYINLLRKLDRFNMVVLGFKPLDKKQYGILEFEGEIVNKITEWKYWKDYPEQKQGDLNVCNSGIYAIKRADLAVSLDFLKKIPHIVQKEINGEFVEFAEFFITDLIELLKNMGLRTGYILTENEEEVMGIDDKESLKKAQSIFQKTSHTAQ